MTSKEILQAERQLKHLERSIRKAQQEQQEQINVNTIVDEEIHKLAVELADQ